MGWSEGVVIRGGYLQGSLLGISNNIGIETAALGYIVANNNVNRSEGETVRDEQEIWYNTDFDKMIDVSSYFSFTHADFSDECIADIALLDVDRNVTGYFSIYLSRSGTNPVYMTVTGKLKNASGVIQGSFNSSGSIVIQTSVSGGEAPKCYLCLAKTTYSDNTIFGMYFNFNQWWYGNGHYWGTRAIAGAFIDNDTIYNTWGIGGGIDTETKKKSPEFGPASEPGGYGGGGSPMPTHNHGSDHNKIPGKPQYGFTSAGFLNHYNISTQGLSMLGEALFPAPILSSPDVPTAIDRMTANMWNSKIIDYVIDCRILPVKPHDDGYHNITCGGKVLVHPTTGAIYTGALIDEDFVDVDCGYVVTPPTEGNFLDYYQLSCKLFLPFYGYVDIAPEYWNGAKIGVYYRFNMMDGSFMVWITSKAFASDLEEDDIIAQYAGNACIHLPINSLSYSNIISGMITTGAAIVGTVAGAGALGAAATGKAAAKLAARTDASVAGQVASGAANVINSRPQLNANNSYNGSASMMSARRPHLLIEFNNAQFSTKYVDEKGLPLVVEKRIGDMSGMVVCDAPILNFGTTEEIGREIMAALREGIIV